MSFKRCPGSLGFVQPKPEIVSCPECKSDVEIWSDEATGECPSCGRHVIRSQTQSCVDWCRYARDCLGEEKYTQYGEMKAQMRRSALVAAMENYFGEDSRRIEHAKSVLAYAESILPGEPEADPNVVVAAALLHDIGIPNAEAKTGSSGAAAQEREGPPVAREILGELGYPDEFVDEVCDIVGHHHHPRSDETTNFKVLYDADILTNTEETGQATEDVLDLFMTDKGRRIGKELKRRLR